jgi:FkbM family methyltransferase
MTSLRSALVSLARQHVAWGRRLALGCARRLITLVPPAAAAEEVCNALITQGLIRHSSNEQAERIYQAIIDGASPMPEKELADIIIAKKPQLLVDEVIRLEPSLAIEGLVAQNPGMAIDTFVTRLPKMIVDEVVLKEPRMVVDEVVLKEPRMVVDEVVLKEPRMVVDEAIGRSSEMVVARLNDALPTFGLRQESYAQEGEDLVLARIFATKIDGFYVDVGAHHPIRFSNTYLLYRRGWRGINIDATPHSMDEFNRVRPRDINIECLVSSDESSQTFYMLNEPALNTVSADLAHQRGQEDSHYRVTGSVLLKSRRLASILDERLPPTQAIDVLNVDVEGLDLDVLRSNDWARYRPMLVLVELLATNGANLERHEITQFLRDQGYEMTSKFFNTVLFQRQTGDDALSSALPSSPVVN